MKDTDMMVFLHNQVQEISPTYKYKFAVIWNVEAPISQIQEEDRQQLQNEPAEQTPFLIFGYMKDVKITEKADPGEIATIEIDLAGMTRIKT